MLTIGSSLSHPGMNVEGTFLRTSTLVPGWVFLPIRSCAIWDLCDFISSNPEDLASISYGRCKPVGLADELSHLTTHGRLFPE